MGFLCMHRCTLFHSDWGASRFFPTDLLAPVPSSTFYVRERSLGHRAVAGNASAAVSPATAGGVDARTVRCPMLTSGRRFTTIAELEQSSAMWSDEPIGGGGGGQSPLLNLSSGPRLIAFGVDTALEFGRKPLSDLEQCSPTPEELEAEGSGVDGYTP